MGDKKIDDLLTRLERHEAMCAYLLALIKAKKDSEKK